MPDLSNKVALITGASSGIGGETAVHFASLGCWLALTGRDQAALDKVATLCRSKGLPQEKVLVISGDLCKEDDVANVVKKTLEHFGKLDILVNSAGIIKNGTTEATPLAVYDQVMNINLRSVFHVMQVAIPHLRKTKGGKLSDTNDATETIIVHSATLLVRTRHRQFSPFSFFFFQYGGFVIETTLVLESAELGY